jgi:catechol 2,3-dioxygenase-like lactoylglutathione lyase family enzyme
MLQHVTCEIPRETLDQCVWFYGTLGFREVPAPEGIAGRAVWLEHARTQIHLRPVAEASPPSGHVGIVVDSYEKTLERLRAAGLEIDRRRPHWGSPRVYVHDPAGNLVELMAWGPGEREERR